MGWQADRMRVPADQLVWPDPEAYAAHVAAFLGAHPPEHTLPATVLDGLRRGSYHDHLLAALDDAAGAVVAVLVQTPPRAAIVAGEPAAAARLATRLAAAGATLPGVIGLARGVRAFTDAWTRAAGTSAQTLTAQRLFRLDTLIAPRAAPGAMRVCGDADAVVVAAWTADFAVEAETSARTDDDLDAARSVITDGRRFVWAVESDAVALAGRSRALDGTARIGPVFTPPGLRGRGYAGNLVAALAGQIMAEGAVPSLFARIDHPVPNRLYAALGFTPVADQLEVDFGSRR